jgi:hypothetical protein
MDWQYEIAPHAGEVRTRVAKEAACPDSFPACWAPVHPVPECVQPKGRHDAFSAAARPRKAFPPLDQSFLWPVQIGVMTFHLRLPVASSAASSLLLSESVIVSPTGLSKYQYLTAYSTADFLPQSKRLPRIPLTIR